MILLLLMGLFLLMSAFGGYLTIESRKDPQKDKLSDWIRNNIKLFKWLGPVLLGVGIFGCMVVVWLISRNSARENSNFGFKFY